MGGQRAAPKDATLAVKCISVTDQGAMKENTETHHDIFVTFPAEDFLLAIAGASSGVVRALQTTEMNKCHRFSAPSCL